MKLYKQKKEGVKYMTDTVNEKTNRIIHVRRKHFNIEEDEDDEDFDTILESILYPNGHKEIESKEYNEVKFTIKSMDEIYEEDKKNGNAFIITDKLGEVKGVRSENGIYSPKYGSIWEDENAFEEMYSCDCGEKKGKIYLGEYCEKCDSYVRFKSKNIDMTGYFYLINYYIIHPTLFKIIGSLIGMKKLKTILNPKWETDRKGIPQKPIIDEDTRNINKYDYIGPIEFKERFDEIIDFFYSKKKNKKNEYYFIKKMRNAVFSKYIPVESIILRPFSLSDEDYMYDPINTDYSILSTKIYNLNHKFLILDDENCKIVNSRLFQVQLRLDSIATKIAQGLNKKHGLIRNNIQGSRYNHSTRAVISPMANGKINEVDFPYLGFLEMYRPEIIFTLCKLYDVTINDAYVLWKKAQLTFDKRVYNIMNYLVENNDLYILLNRNPTINFGSIMRMKIRKVKKRYDDLVINIPINTLAKYAGDFDGDAGNTISLKDTELVDAYELYDPRTHMMISKTDGLFDEDFNLIKDQLIGLHQFCKLSRVKIGYRRLK